MSSVLPANPFRLGIAAQDAITDGAWGDAARTGFALLQSGPGLTVLVGPSGVGKTLLLHEIELRCQARQQKVILIRQGTEALEQGRDSPLFHESPDAFLLIDEMKPSAGVCAALALLEERHCLIVVQPSFESVLEDLPVSPAVIRLNPLSHSAARAFVVARLQRALRPASVFSSEALDHLVQRTSGIPRLLCAVGGGALYLAASEGDEQVTVAHVEQALEFGGFQPAEPKFESVPAPPPPVPSLPLEMPAFAAISSERLSAQDGEPNPQRGRVIALVILAIVAAGATWAAFQPLIRSSTEPVDAAVAQPQGDVQEKTEPPTPPLREAAAAVPLPPPVLAMPGSRPHLVISFPRGADAAAQQATHLSKALSQAGYSVGDPLPAPAFLGASSLRVTYAEDLPAATQLRNVIGAATPTVSLAPLIKATGLPRPGTIAFSLAAGDPGDVWAQTIEQATPLLALSSTADFAISPLSPADGATIAPDEQRHVRLAWPTGPDQGAAYFVEIHQIRTGSTREILATFAERGSVAFTPPPGHADYAWRVQVIDRNGPHYRSSRWFRFVVDPSG